MEIITKPIIRGGCLAAVIIILVATILPLPIVMAENVQPMPTITPTPAQPQPINFADYFRLNVLSLAALIGGLGVIFAAIAKVFKPIRTWFVNWVRKALHIEDSNKINEERMSALEAKINNESDERKKEFLAMKMQNDTITGSLACLLAATDEINRKMTMAEDSNKSLLLDTITNTYNKYCKKKAIPLHEKKRMSDMCDVYRSYIDDSYITWIIESSSDWQVIPSDSAPPSNANT